MHFWVPPHPYTYPASSGRRLFLSTPLPGLVKFLLLRLSVPTRFSAQTWHRLRSGDVLAGISAVNWHIEGVSRRDAGMGSSSQLPQRLCCPSQSRAPSPPRPSCCGPATSGHMHQAQCITNRCTEHAHQHCACMLQVQPAKARNTHICASIRVMPSGCGGSLWNALACV